MQSWPSGSVGRQVRRTQHRATADRCRSGRAARVSWSGASTVRCCHDSVCRGTAAGRWTAAGQSASDRSNRQRHYGVCRGGLLAIQLLTAFARVTGANRFNGMCISRRRHASDAASPETSSRPHTGRSTDRSGDARRPDRSLAGPDAAPWSRTILQARHPCCVQTLPG